MPSNSREYKVVNFMDSVSEPAVYDPLYRQRVAVMLEALLNTEAKDGWRLDRVCDENDGYCTKIKYVIFHRDKM